MDGLHKLIEMLEKRFGKFWADCLLLIVVLGAAAWAIHSVFGYLIFPAVRGYKDLADYFQHGGRVHVSMTDVWVNVAQIALTVFVGIVGIGYLRYIRKRAMAAARFAEQSLSSAHALITQEVGDAKEIVADCRAFTTENHRKLRALLNEAEQKWLEVAAKERELEAKYPQAVTPQALVPPDKQAET